MTGREVRGEIFRLYALELAAASEAARVAGECSAARRGVRRLCPHPFNMVWMLPKPFGPQPRPVNLTCDACGSPLPTMDSIGPAEDAADVS